MRCGLEVDYLECINDKYAKQFDKLSIEDKNKIQFDKEWYIRFCIEWEITRKLLKKSAN